MTQKIVPYTKIFTFMFSVNLVYEKLPYIFCKTLGKTSTLKIAINLTLCPITVHSYLKITISADYEHRVGIDTSAK